MNKRMTTRRNFLRASLLSAGGMALPGTIPGLFANPANGTPMRFIFMHRGNGLFPKVMVPPSLSQQDKAREEKRNRLRSTWRRMTCPSGWLRCRRTRTT